MPHHASQLLEKAKMALILASARTYKCHKKHADGDLLHELMDIKDGIDKAITLLECIDVEKETQDRNLVENSLRLELPTELINELNKTYSRE